MGPTTHDHRHYLVAMSHPVVIMGQPRDPNGTRPPLRARIRALCVVPRLLRLVWETKPAYAAAMIVLRLTRSVVPVTNGASVTSRKSGRGSYLGVVPPAIPTDLTDDASWEATMLDARLTAATFR